MPAVSRLGDPCTGHGCWGPRPSVGAASTVFVNGIAAHRLGDAWDTHACPPAPPHGAQTAGASGTVYVEGMAVARIGDPLDCGSSIAGGSGDVFAG